MFYYLDFAYEDLRIMLTLDLLVLPAVMAVEGNSNLQASSKRNQIRHKAKLGPATSCD